MKIAWTLLLVACLTCGAIVAAEPTPRYSSILPGAYDELDVTEPADASYVIFSNLDSKPHDRFNGSEFATFPIAGNRSSETETWYAIRFSPKVDVQATTLSAAVGYTSGTKLVSIGLYSNNENTDSVGDPLPGGQADTSRIPDLDQCCQLAKVTLPGDGVTLSANQLYWLVVGPDNEQGANFLGGWHVSNLAASANFTPNTGWLYPDGQWPAAEIRGVKLEVGRPNNCLRPVPLSIVDVSNTIIFSNLNRTSDKLYSSGSGVPVDGNLVPFEPEIWEALPFAPKADFHARTLAAAIAWVSGTKLVNLGIYSDNAGKVGTLLPGGQGSTSEIPNLGDCCELTKVRLPGAGVQLSAGVQYWLVASPDNTQAPTFQGAWQESELAVHAYQQPENFINWTSVSGYWFAAEIRGTSP